MPLDYKDREIRPEKDETSYCEIFDGCSNTLGPRKRICDECILTSAHNLNLKELTDKEIIEAVNIHVLLN
jgi:hypothetical protein